jgi:hypothetical protein
MSESAAGIGLPFLFSSATLPGRGTGLIWRGKRTAESKPALVFAAACGYVQFPKIAQKVRESISII